MKEYTIIHNESDCTENPLIIEQCNYNFFKEIIFYGWLKNHLYKPVPQTVAIFKIKWKS